MITLMETNLKSKRRHMTQLCLMAVTLVVAIAACNLPRREMRMEAIAKSIDSQCPAVIIDGMVATGAEYSPKDSCIIINCSIDEIAADMDIAMFTDDYRVNLWKQAWIRSMQRYDQETRDIYVEIADWNCGIKYVLKSEQSGKTVQVTITSDELEYVEFPFKGVPPNIKSKTEVPVSDIGTFTAPKSWHEYTFDFAYWISIPNTMVLVDNEYKSSMSINPDVVVFRQKGFQADTEEKMDRNYGSIWIRHITCEPGTLLKANDTRRIDDDAKEAFNVLIQQKIAPYQKLLGEPTYRLISFNGINAVEIKYRRTGNGSMTTQGIIYLLNNYDEMVEISIAYREQEADVWLPDLNNVIKTFRWNNPHTV